jgi:hypothetical protein
MEAVVAFGRQKAVEPPVEPVGWADVQTFTVSAVERPVTVRRKRAVPGQPAVRVARGAKDLRVLAPCAFLGTVPAPGLPARPEHTLYEDAGTRTLLCYVEQPTTGASADPPATGATGATDTTDTTGTSEAADTTDSADTGERRHVVRDARGEVVGTLVRVPPKRRPLRHTWRIEQPGQPEIVGRNEWVSGDAKEIAGRVAGKVLGGVFSAVGDLGGDGGDQRSKPRTLEWRAGDEIVMVSEGSERVTVRAGWLDRRLAFAFALLGDA